MCPLYCVLVFWNHLCGFWPNSTITIMNQGWLFQNKYALAKDWTLYKVNLLCFHSWVLYLIAIEAEVSKQKMINKTSPTIGIQINAEFAWNMFWNCHPNPKIANLHYSCRNPMYIPVGEGYCLLILSTTQDGATFRLPFPRWPYFSKINCR